ncbi:MAG: transposase [Caulobacter sp.]|nr:transposase [Caulobacter sp.]
MGRKARIVAPGVPHHVTQRGNRRQATFLRAADYLSYLQLAGEAFAEAGVQVWCWCLMPNHVHLIATPPDEGALARAVGLTHLRYTRLINGRERWTGYLWQGRFASFPMDEDYLRQCVRYVGLNPVRAGLVERAVDWPWSSVRAHLGRGTDPLLTPGPVATLLGDGADGFFDVDLAEEAQRKLRRACRSGRPLGAADWVKALDRAPGN